MIMVIKLLSNWYQLALPIVHLLNKMVKLSIFVLQII